MSTRDPAWNRALVTGASSGLGAVFAQRLAAQGTHLVLVARRGDRLAELAEHLRDEHPGPGDLDVEVLPADLATEPGVQAVTARLADDDAPIDLLINNAGVATVGRLHRRDPDGERDLLRLNLEAPVLLTQAHLAGLTRRGGRGGLINVASLSGMIPMPVMASYSASKAGLIAFTESLAAAYADHEIHLQALCPGFVRTDMAAGHEEATSRIPDLLWLEADQVVDASLASLGSGRLVVVPGWSYRALRRGSALLPGSVLRRITALASR